MCEGSLLKVKYLLLATISGAIVAFDQLTKLYIHTHFNLGESYVLLPGFFDITYVRNYGAAFGILATSARWFREPFFALVPFIALAVILLILRTTKEDQKWQITALSLIFGGAIGNYIDRLRFKYVIDFLDFHFQEVYHWPAFNVADSAIVCGVGILLVQIMFTKQNSNAPLPAKEDTP
jgi:signal peptidase II